jgi:hypothetical protein
VKDNREALFPNFTALAVKLVLPVLAEMPIRSIFTLGVREVGHTSSFS